MGRNAGALRSMTGGLRCGHHRDSVSTYLKNYVNSWYDYFALYRPQPRGKYCVAELSKVRNWTRLSTNILYHF